jgi:hypothetical protein
VIFEDDRLDYGERRLVTLGLLAGRVVVIAHSPHNEGTGNGVNKKSIKSDLARIDSMKDAEIDHSDIPALDKIVSQEGSRRLATRQETIDNPLGRGCVAMAQRPWQRLSDADQSHPTRCHGESTVPRSIKEKMEKPE